MSGEPCTPIQLAIYHQAWSVVEVLVRHSVALNQPPDLSEPKHFVSGPSIIRGLSHDVWKILVSTASLLPPDCLEMASRYCDSFLVEIFIDSATDRRKWGWLVTGQFHTSLAHAQAWLIPKLVRLMFEITPSPDVSANRCTRCKSTGCFLPKLCLMVLLAQRGDFSMIESLFHSNKAYISQNTLRCAAEAGREDIVRFLLELGASAFELSCFRDTAYSVAIKNQHHSLIQLFGALEVPLSAKNHSFEAEFRAALDARDGNQVRRLVQYASLEKRHWLEKCVELAIEKDEPDIALALFDQLGSRTSVSRYVGEKLLLAALVRRKPGHVSALLDTDVDVESGRAMSIAVKWGDVGVVQALISAGFLLDFDDPDLPYFRSPLYFAVRDGNKNMVDFLLKAGAGLNCPSSRTPLRAAVQNRDRDMVMHLLSWGADPNDSAALLAAIVCRKRPCDRKPRYISPVHERVGDTSGYHFRTRCDLCDDPVSDDFTCCGFASGHGSYEKTLTRTTRTRIITTSTTTPIIAILTLVRCGATKNALMRTWRWSTYLSKLSKSVILADNVTTVLRLYQGQFGRRKMNLWNILFVVALVSIPYVQMAACVRPHSLKLFA